MAIRKANDSGVDRITHLALRGVNAFMTMYQDDEPAIAAGPVPGKPAKPAAKRTTRKTARR